MNQEKINPNIIELHYVTTSNDPGLYGSANSGIIFPPDPTYIQKPCIEIYKALLNKPRNEHFFTYSHELQHICLGHTLIMLVMPYTKKLLSLQEREANLHAASKNIHHAYTGMIVTSTGSHSDIIDNEAHSDEMAIMYALLHKKESLLQNNTD